MKGVRRFRYAHRHHICIGQPLVQLAGRVERFGIFGAGAAGGLGAAFAGILGGRMRRGIDIVLDAVGFADRVEGASLVITGEGRIDAQTIMGKTPAGVLEAAAKKGIPVMAIGGSVEAGTQLPGFVSIVQATPPGMTLSEAMKSDVARRNIEEAAFRAIKEYYKL